MNLTITNPPTLEENPLVLRRTSDPSDARYECAEERYKGFLARVSVKTGEDWRLITMLRHGIDYFAPATGNGLLVKPEFLNR